MLLNVYESHRDWEMGTTENKTSHGWNCTVNQTPIKDYLLYTQHRHIPTQTPWWANTHRKTHTEVHKNTHNSLMPVPQYGLRILILATTIGYFFPYIAAKYAISFLKSVPVRVNNLHIMVMSLAWNHIVTYWACAKIQLQYTVMCVCASVSVCVCDPAWFQGK